NGQQVYVEFATGKLGFFPSSRRFKEKVRDMGRASDGLRHLRPVTFYYKQAQEGGPSQLQYGLIAEEVETVYPELVEYSETAEPLTVRYHLLPAMLLNEVQKQYAQIAELQAAREQQEIQIAELQAQRHEQAAQIAELRAQLATIAGRLEQLDR